MLLATSATSKRNSRRRVSLACWFLCLVTVVALACSNEAASMPEPTTPAKRVEPTEPHEPLLSEYVTCLDVAINEIDSVRRWSTRGSPIILDYIDLRMVNQTLGFVVCEGTAVFDNGFRRADLLFGREIDCGDLEILPTREWKKRVRVGTANIGGVCIATRSQGATPQ